MSESNNGLVEGVRGVVEDAIGKAKEITGIVINNDGLREGGRAQQDAFCLADDIAIIHRPAQSLGALGVADGQRRVGGEEFRESARGVVEGGCLSRIEAQ